MIEDEWKRPLETLKKAMVMKKNMISKGIVAAKAKCPYCEGYWHGRLAGHKKHLHMACDGDCKAIMME